METNPFKLLLLPTLSMETELFLFVCWSGVKSSPDSVLALTRFKVKTISVKKKTQPPFHEFLLMDVRDRLDSTDKLFILERNVDLDADEELKTNVVDEFLLHEDCKKVLNAIFRALLTIPTTVLVGAAAVAAGPALSGLSVPAVASAIIPLSVATSFLPSFSHTPEVDSYLPRTNPVMGSSQNSIVDRTTLTAADFFHRLSEFSVSRRMSKSLNKPPKDSRADDRWLSGVRVETPEFGTAQGAQSFEAFNLNLFHMALLAHVVHTEYPLYSLFKRNCYWFSMTFYLAAQTIDKSLGSRPDLPDRPEEGTDNFFLPFSLYMPEVAGRWMGFKICEVQKMMVDHIVRLFLKKLGEHEKMVFTIFLNYQLQLTNFLTGL